MIDGVSVDGCYEINTAMGTLGYHSYLAGPLEDGVAVMVVASYSVSSLLSVHTTKRGLGIIHRKLQIKQFKENHRGKCC